MKLKITVVALSILALSACGGSGGGNGDVTGGPSFKEDLRTAAKTAPTLTDAQKQKFVKLMSTQRAFHPSSALYFDRYEKPERKEKDLKILNEVGRQFLLRVQKNCQISPEREDSGASSQDDGSYTTKRTKSVGGEKCPINYAENETSVSKTLNYNRSTNTMTAKMTSSGDITERILDSEMQKKMPFFELQSHNENDTQYFDFKVEDGKVLSGYAQTTSHSSLSAKSLNGETISGTVVYEMIWTTTGKKAQALFKMNLPDGNNIVIGLFVTDKKSEILVNGQPYTAEEFKKDFNEAIELPID